MCIKYCGIFDIWSVCVDFFVQHLKTVTELTKVNTKTEKMKVDSDLKSTTYGDENSGAEDDGDFQSEDVSSNGFHTKSDMRKVKSSF